MSSSNTPAEQPQASQDPTNPQAPPAVKPKFKRRPKPPANPLVDRRKQGPKRPPTSAPLGVKQATKSASATPPAPNPESANPTVTVTEDNEEWTTFKLTTTKAAMLHGLRHHVMKFQVTGTRVVDPTDEKDFTQPVRLHRRDPKAPLQGMQHQMLAKQKEALENAANEEEDSKAAAERAVKDAQKAEIASRMAPDEDVTKKKPIFKKKLVQHFTGNEKERALRYEEYYPWFLEDYDNKNTWYSHFEPTLSDNAYAMFVLEEGAFRMVPIEKYYKFHEQRAIRTFDIDEIDAIMKKTQATPRWVMHITKEKEKEEAEAQKEATLQGWKKSRGIMAERSRSMEETDFDALDFEEEFADDEEAPLVEGEGTDVKEVEERLKKDRLGARVFDLKDEGEIEREEMLKNRKKEQAKKAKKKLVKRLVKYENNHMYDQEDSDDDPYRSPSPELDSDEERAIKEDERIVKEKEEAKAKADAEEAEKNKGQKAKDEGKDKDKVDKSKAPAKKDSKGKTPTNGAVAGTKRPGDGNLSEANSDKARKKPKKSSISTNAGPSSLAVPASTVAANPAKGAAAITKKRKNRPLGDGATSGEDTAGETSDGANKKPRIMLTSKGRALSPTANGSRQGSPTPVSRPGSPPAQGTSRATSPSTGQARPAPASITESDVSEFVKGIGAKGATVSEIAKAFKGRVRNIVQQNQLATIIKQALTEKIIDGKKYYFPK